jgi:hypothetical protein
MLKIYLEGFYDDDKVLVDTWHQSIPRYFEVENRKQLQQNDEV